MAKTLLERAARWAKDHLDAATAIEVVYIVGVHAKDGLKAIPGNAAFANVDVEQAVASAKRFDWIVASDELIVNFAKVEPATGHLIRHRLPDGRTAVYEVTPEAGGRCYSVSDQLGVLYRVHTKMKDIEAAP